MGSLADLVVDGYAAARAGFEQIIFILKRPPENAGTVKDCTKVKGVRLNVLTGALPLTARYGPNRRRLLQTEHQIEVKDRKHANSIGTTSHNDQDCGRYRGLRFHFEVQTAV